MQGHSNLGRGPPNQLMTREGHRMNSWLSPGLLLLALAMLVVAIAMMAVGPPEAGVMLHQARAENNEPMLEVWEDDLQRRQRKFWVVESALLIGSVLATIQAFQVMKK